MNYSQDINNKYLANKGRGSGGRWAGGGGVVRQSLIIWFLQIYHHNYFRY